MGGKAQRISRFTVVPCLLRIALARPKCLRLMSRDYRTNIKSYPKWQRWLKTHSLPTLAIWRKHDLAFTVPGAWAFRRDLPKAQIEILDTGRFVMNTGLDEVARLATRFQDSNRAHL